MATPVYWPGNILKPQDISVDIAHRSLRGPSATNGFTQVVSNSAGIWSVKYTGVPVYSAAMIKLWRALDTLIEGQLNPISLPVWDYPRSPGSTDELGTNLYNWYQGVPHSDGSYFSDGSDYLGYYTNITTSSSAGIGTVTLSVLKSFPILLEPGQRFSINDRLYQIKSISAQDDTSATFIVRPPFREFVAVGSRCEFDQPRVRVKLTSDNAMFLPLSFNRQSFPDLEFVEDV